MKKAAAAVLILVAGCGGAPDKPPPPPENPQMGVARVTPKNGSTVQGLISFTQVGDRVRIAGQFFELFPGPHSLYIHAVGNCSSPNAASAGPVWNVPGNTDKRATGALPLLVAGTEGRAEVTTSLSTMSVGTGRPDDVIGRSVVVHADVDPDPKVEYGVPNGWLACGVIVRTEGFDIKKVL